MTRPMHRMERNLLNPRQYVTFQMFRTPDAFHVQECRAAECDGFLNGWMTRIDERFDLGQRQAEYIRHGSERNFSELDEDGVTVFMFTPGQKCFKGEHKVSDGRPPIMIQRGGDGRANLGVERQFNTTDEFVDAFASNQQSLSDAIGKG